MRNHDLVAVTSLAVLFASVFYGCQTEDPGQQLSTNATAMMTNTGGTNMVTSGGGDGGTTSMGGNGGDGVGGSPTGGGQGGTGGAPEEPIHGCLSTSTIDNTGSATVDIGYPIAAGNWPYCLSVSLNTTVTVGNDGSAGVGDMLIVGGSYDGQAKVYDASSPIQPDCLDPNNAGCYAGGTWLFGLAGVYPFYDNSDPDARAGVVYVVP